MVKPGFGFLKVSTAVFYRTSHIYLGDNDLTPRIKLVTPVLPEEGELQIDSNQSATLNIVNHSLLFSVKVRYAIALIS